MEGIRTEEGSSVLVLFPDPVTEAEGVAEVIKSLVSSGSCRYSDIGILLRTVQGSGTPFINQFGRSHIPFILSGQAGLFKRRENPLTWKVLCWLFERGFFPLTVHSRKDTISGERLLRSGVEDWLIAVQSGQTEEILLENIRYWKERVLD